MGVSYFSRTVQAGKKITWVDGLKSYYYLFKARFLDNTPSTLISTIIFVKDDWNPENEILTPTMKIKRNKINDKYHGKFKDWSDNKETVILE